MDGTEDNHSNNPAGGHKSSCDNSCTEISNDIDETEISIRNGY